MRKAMEKERESKKKVRKEFQEEKRGETVKNLKFPSRKC